MVDDEVGVRDMTEIWRRKHYSKQGGWNILSVDLEERNGIPYIVVHLEKYQESHIAFRLSVSEAVKLVAAILNEVAKYPLIIGDRSRSRKKWKPRKMFKRDKDIKPGQDKETKEEEL